MYSYKTKVCQNVVYIYIYFVKIWYTSVVAIHLVPNFCIQNVYTVSVVWPSHATQDVFSWCGQ